MDTASREHRIVVGIDGSPRSRAALRWAMEEARGHTAVVRAVELTAPSPERLVPAAAMGLNPYGGPPRPRERTDAQRLADLVAETAAQVDHAPPVVDTVVPGHRGRELARIAEDADLLVIGAHHHPTHVSTGVGAFAADLLRHATCPVVIVPAV
ncbi:Nucleotide-binding universal stress protein, UspA family [Actinokineospora alba]|uniref:Nucleotide-binding universal stress protein, UspA family n=1 Tax=Actinokineospora alba TaxID=504798 RepID=A0A1H0FL82_9PSEU|nr:universal stress protein [Actinokineospora alba]TDP69528.1 nucleotide-binding universal stress UspA family protein [Actinokineospora alba]SDI14866.1 Nucleotide-binding universal stress protein, UspA family [Actinokineospora alba]SDN95528.1 Nucleotide-binding universal stress protein, UspA family [Actinokineospora alba]